MSGRKWTAATLAVGLVGSLTGCMTSAPSPRVAPPVYLHVPCSTPGARVEQPIDTRESSPKSGGKPVDATDREQTCVVERGRTG